MMQQPMHLQSVKLEPPTEYEVRLAHRYSVESCLASYGFVNPSFLCAACSHCDARSHVDALGVST